jgi:hypothetical protein
VRARVKSVSASPAICGIRWINILEVLPLILEHTRVLETGAILQPPNIASEHAGSASLKAAHEHILAVTFILVLHSRYFCFMGFSLILAQC